VTHDARSSARPDAAFFPMRAHSEEMKTRARSIAEVGAPQISIALDSRSGARVGNISDGAKAVINDPGVVATAEKVPKAAFRDKFTPSPPVTPSEHNLGSSTLACPRCS
jgi:hypothetical protein